MWRMLAFLCSFFLCDHWLVVIGLFLFVDEAVDAHAFFAVVAFVCSEHDLIYYDGLILVYRYWVDGNHSFLWGFLKIVFIFLRQFFVRLLCEVFIALFF